MKRLQHCVLLALLGMATLPPALAETSMTFVMEPFPPFSHADKGVAGGPFPEVLNAVCASLQIHCKIEVMPWRRGFAMAEMGSADGIFVFVHTPEREKDFFFTDPVIQTGYGLFARKSSKLAFATAKDLAGYTVAVYGPSGTSTAAEELTRNATGMRLEIEVDNQAVMRKLDAGRYAEPAAAFMNRDVGNWLITQQKFTNVKLAGEAKKVDYGIGLSRKRVTPEQAERFNQALRELVKKGVIKSIAEKYGLKAAN